MKKVIASAGMLAISAFGVQTATAEMSVADKPWSISGTLRGFYDDNYNTQPSGTPAYKSSWGLEVRPRADVAWASGPLALTASYIYDLRDYFSRPGNKLDQSHDVELFANDNFNERFSLDVEESFVDSQEPEVVDANLGLPFRANGDNIRNTAAINLHGELTPLLGFVVGYANSYYNYMGTTPGVLGPAYSISLNRFEHLVTLNSRWHVAEDTVAIFGYQFTAVDYTDNGVIGLVPVGGVLTPVTSKSRDNYTHNVYVGIEHSFGSTLTFSGRAGFQASDYYNTVPGTTDPNSINPFVDMSLTWAYLPDGSMTIGFRNSKNQTDVAQTSLNSSSIVMDEESSSVYGGITQKLSFLTPALSASLNAEYQNSRFNDGSGNRDDNFFLLGLNLTYQFNRYFSTEVGYNYDRLDSDVGGRGYDRNRVYFGVTGTY